MTTPELKRCFIGTDTARVAGGDADMGQGSSVFFPFVSLTLPFLLSLPHFLYPSLTRTKPICSETRVTGGVDKPCSCAFPPRCPPALPFFSLSSSHSTLSFSTQLPPPHRGGDVGAPALRNLIPVTRPPRYNALAPHGVMVLYLRSSPLGF